MRRTCPVVLFASLFGVHCDHLSASPEHGVPIWNPATVLQGPDDVMYGANHTGEIYSLRDTDGDDLEDTAQLFCDVREDGLRAPAGLAFSGRNLYVGTAQEVRIYTDRNGT